MFCHTYFILVIFGLEESVIHIVSFVKLEYANWLRIETNI